MLGKNNKKYCDFMDEISADELYEGLLGYGLFSEKIPPVFTSVPFYEYCQQKDKKFDSTQHECITFVSNRNTNKTRIISIPDPMKYQVMCTVLRDNWPEIKKHFHRQTDNDNYKVSRIHLRKIEGEKALFQMNYKNWKIDGDPESELLSNKNHVSKLIVKADISQCFASIYTHVIPWALVGTETAKANRDEEVWYNQIDVASRNMTNGETNGIPIGIHSSNLISEIILTTIDHWLTEKGYNYFRNIDDYVCFVSDEDEGNKFLVDLQEILKNYHLRINEEKTKKESLPAAIEKSWKNQLNNINLISPKYGITTFTEVNRYIDKAIELCRQDEDYAPLNYAIKTLSGKKLSDNAKKQATTRFLHAAVLKPYLLRLMEKFVFDAYQVDNSDIKNYSDQIYSEAKKAKNYEGISYSIYYSLRYGFDLEDLDISWIIQQGDCISLLLSWLYYLRINKGNLRATDMKIFNCEAKRLSQTNMDKYWLFCYEVLTVGNLFGDWCDMKRQGVSFIIDSYKPKTWK